MAAEPGFLPRRIGTYPVVRRLAAGGMGEVFVVEHPRLRRPCALKVAGKTGALAQARFAREAETLGRLRHRHLVRLVDQGRDVRLGPYLVMELVNPSGRTLRELVDAAAPFSQPKAAATLVRQLAEALAVLHGEGLVHRDVKPSNVLLRPGGEPVLADLGLVRGAEDETFTRADAAPGSPPYMSPEQHAPGSVPVDARSDVFSLGVVLYELLVGERPFLPPCLERAIRERDPLPPRRARARAGTRAVGSAPLDPELETICLTCLAKDPAERYASAKALGEDLARYLAGESIQARPPPWSRRLRRWAERRRALLAACAGSLALLVLGLAPLRGMLAVAQAELVHHTQSEESARVQAQALAQAERAQREARYAQAEEAFASVRSGEVRISAERRAIAQGLAHELDPQVGELAVAALVQVVAVLREAERELYLSAAQPTESERLAGAETIGGLPEALARRARGEALSAPERRVLEAAETRLLRRARRGGGGVARVRPRGLLDLLAAQQDERLGRPGGESLKLACEILGAARFVPARAVLGELLRAEAQPIRAAWAAAALMQMSGSADPALDEARRRFADEPLYARKLEELGELAPGQGPGIR